jgi:hypothetical protein
MNLRTFIVFLSFIGFPMSAPAATFTTLSPDGSISMTVEINNSLSYSVVMDGTTIISQSKLQMIMEDGGISGNTVQLLSQSTASVNESWTPVVGRKSLIANHYNQRMFNLSETHSPSITYGLECRVYNEGVAFRYIFPAASSSQRIKIKEEFSEFRFQANHTCWPAFLNSYTTEHQALYPQSTLSDIQTDSIIGLPLTIQMNDGKYCSITEASLFNWAGMYLTNAGLAKLFFSGEMNGGDSGMSVSAELPSGTNQLRILIDGLGSINHDHVDIANAKLFKANGDFVWLSDLTPTYARQDYGSLQKDKSINGNTLTIGGQQYSKGIGSHASAEIIYEFNPEFIRMEAVVGMDSEVGSNGSAAIRLFSGVSEQYNHSVALFSSGTMNGGDAGVTISKDLPSGTNQLRLVADGFSDLYCDHVDIANTKLIKSNGDFIWLSSLNPTFSRQDWETLHNNASVDGNILTIGGQQYQKGLGTHANAEIVYDFAPDYVRFEAVVGIDSEVGPNGQAAVTVYSTVVNQTQYSLRSTVSRLDESGNAVELTSPHHSPWRTITLGRNASDLLNSDMVLNLNEPSQISDTSWIKAGVASWNWLSCDSDMDMNLLKGFIDLSASMGWEYSLIDYGWYKNDNCTTPIDILNMPELVSYAAGKNVKLWLWVHWQTLNARLEQALSLYESWGIAGVKIDFMSRDDQWMVNWQNSVLQTAASHKLMIDFHGCHKPTGENRTWPNLMACEAVNGEEQNLGSRLNDPIHKTTLPFTRMLAGPMDYTPGSFLNETQTSWFGGRPVKSLGTRCQELALCMIYDTHLISMADKPENYYGQIGLEFLQNLPASWDDTKVLNGQIGQYLTTARKKGDTWYLGAITNWDSRTMNIPLSFLGSGSYNVVLFEDGPNAGTTNARDVNRQEITVTAQDTLSVDLASGGGFVAILTKAHVDWQTVLNDGFEAGVTLSVNGWTASSGATWLINATGEGNPTNYAWGGGSISKNTGYVIGGNEMFNLTFDVRRMVSLVFDGSILASLYYIDGANKVILNTVEVTEDQLADTLWHAGAGNLYAAATDASIGKNLYVNFEGGPSSWNGTSAQRLGIDNVFIQKTTLCEVADINYDTEVNVVDLMIFCQAWLNTSPDASIDIWPDNIVNMEDFLIFSKCWNR